MLFGAQAISLPPRANREAPNQSLWPVMSFRYFDINIYPFDVLCTLECHSDFMLFLPGLWVEYISREISSGLQFL